ncbi:MULTISPECIES: hypothetical protein [unclassified Halomonas]|uniref:hypothetical protein n=1 Tax=unclassified Halomonas TaxID=2609666 RepID=UPI0021E4D3E8|nr:MULTISPECIES: hypothetical protein [unclassified Halomonas]UYF99634.1 hypothetical protein OCT39_15645 [Halomonas sp. GD1P12]WNL39275.1 hypothetical protein RN346_01605 [Halomonas sp. PAMB 3232]WNL42616.1 hypothetical protein RN347_01595 [Halomonas sp. PAMB 3264]
MARDKWIGAIAMLVVLCCLVPYTLLSNVAAWYGSFLFWSVAGVVVIALNVFITKGFKEHDRD